MHLPADHPGTEAFLPDPGSVRSHRSTLSSIGISGSSVRSPRLIEKALLAQAEDIASSSAHNPPPIFSAVSSLIPRYSFLVLSFAALAGRSSTLSSFSSACFSTSSRVPSTRSNFQSAPRISAVARTMVSFLSFRTIKKLSSSFDIH